MIDFNNNGICTGCSACVSACPYSALSFANNEEGFSFPKIDLMKCKNCGICEKVCPLDKHQVARKSAYYVVQNRDILQRKESQSGGLFSAVASVVLSEKGICYGAGFAEDYEVFQLRIDSIDDLHRLQGSKYVQSNPSNSYKQVENDLRSGRWVLYSGTSCMIAGLYSYLSFHKVCLDNLVTCDLICHGVPSPQLWKDNIQRQIHQYGKLIKTKFRDKKHGWHSHVESYLFESGAVVDEGYYTDLFYSHVALRACCYECKYINNEIKPADITMADFWGISDTKIELTDDNTGISLAITHSTKGLDLLRRANLLVIDIDAASATINNMHSSAQLPQWRNQFWKDYKKHGYEYCLRKYSIYGGIVFKLKRKILKMIGKW